MLKNLDLKSKSLIFALIYILVAIAITIKFGKFPLKAPGTIIPIIFCGLNYLVLKSNKFTAIVIALLIFDSLILIAYFFS